jgi:hypothetical protein
VGQAEARGRCGERGVGEVVLRHCASDNDEPKQLSSGLLRGFSVIGRRFAQARKSRGLLVHQSKIAVKTLRLLQPVIGWFCILLRVSSGVQQNDEKPLFWASAKAFVLKALLLGYPIAALLRKK